MLPFSRHRQFSLVLKLQEFLVHVYSEKQRNVSLGGLSKFITNYSTLLCFRKKERTMLRSRLGRLMHVLLN